MFWGMPYGVCLGMVDAVRRSVAGGGGGGRQKKNKVSNKNHPSNHQHTV